MGRHPRHVCARVGDAVDIGPSDAAAWLSRQGGRYGLCQIYGSEPWHYEGGDSELYVVNLCRARRTLRDVDSVNFLHLVSKPRVERLV